MFYPDRQATCQLCDGHSIIVSDSKYVLIIRSNFFLTSVDSVMRHICCCFKTVSEIRKHSKVLTSCSKGKQAGTSEFGRRTAYPDRQCPCICPGRPQFRP